MADKQSDDQAVVAAQAQVQLPDGVVIRPWQEADFAAVEALSTAQGWKLHKQGRMRP